MRIKIHLALFLLAFLFLLSACGQQPEPSIQATVDAIVESVSMTAPSPVEMMTVTATPTQDEPPITAALSELVGIVMTRTDEGVDFAPAVEGFTLNPPGQVQTDQNSQVRLDLSDKTLIRLGENSLFTLEYPQQEPSGFLSRLRLEFGKIWIIVNGGTVQVETSSGEAAVRGSYMSVSYDPATGEMNVTCLEGDCSLSNEHGTVNFGVGETAVILNADEPPQLGRMSDEDVQDWLDMNPEATLVVPSLTPLATATFTSTPVDTVIWYPPATATYTPKPPPVPTGTNTLISSPAPTVKINSILPTSAVVGQMLTFSASADPVSGGPIPTGTVDIQENGNLLCSVTLNASGGGSCTAMLSNAGTHNIQAFFPGDNYYGSVYSVSKSYSVTSANTTTSLDSFGVTSAVVGEGVTVSFTVAPSAPGSGIPSGNVKVQAGSDFCTALASAGQCVLKSMSAGTHAVVVNFLGDSDYNASSSASVDIDVFQASTTTDIQSFSPNPATINDPVSFTATVDVDSPGSGTPYGSVTFTNTLFASDTCTVSAAPWSCSINFGTPGVWSVAASYSGDSNFNPSVSSSVVQYVAFSNDTYFFNPSGPADGATIALTLAEVSTHTENFSVDVIDIDGISYVELEYTVNDPTFSGTTTKVTLSNSGITTWAADIHIPLSVTDDAYWRFVAYDNGGNTTFFGSGTTTTSSSPAYSYSFGISTP